MRILAIDPGHWTGWAVVESGKDFTSVIALGQFEYREFLTHLSALQLLTSALGITQWIIEDIPDIHPDPKTKELIDLILGAAIDSRVKTERIKPFHWQYLKRSVKPPNLIHSREASEMGMIWLQRLHTS